MSTNYYLQKVPVETVKPGYSLAIREAGEYRLFQVASTHTSASNGKLLIRLTSDGGVVPWVLDYETGTPVVRLFGICEAAAS